MYSHPGNRPRSLKIANFRFPLNALLSGAHRVTGLALVISLIAYLILANLILFVPAITLEQVTDCWLTQLLHTGFWIALTYHWLSGLRHLCAEHFLQPDTYQLINSKAVSYLLLATWLTSSLSITYGVWF
jgi:succinate dehydrogenase / fumarate reductase cytochrome b subunit